MKNIECKARVTDSSALENKLLTLQPRFAGEDRQTDTYFNVPYGRMKLREGNIENALIHYDRPDTAGAKQSTVILYQAQPGATLKQLLTAALGVRVVVAKTRRIYFIDHIKFHFDTVAGLGSFVEVEVIDRDGTMPLEQMQQECAFYQDFFGFQPEDYQRHSYSEMLLSR